MIEAQKALSRAAWFCALVAAPFMGAASAASAGISPAQNATPANSPLEPASSGGLDVVHRALAKLSTSARVLVIGAHPDDEDNALMTWASRGVGAQVGYLSLTRGEGGQNLIGSELGERLGVVREGELAAARYIEGTDQFFTRAFDFGYTRSLEETFERWPKAILMEDALRVVRHFQPHVLVAIFPADERAGHGQHQVSAVVAHEIYERTRTRQWGPKVLFQRAWSQSDEAIRFPLGVLDPLSGRSLAQIAAASRSQHRSQDMGRAQALGDFEGGLLWLRGQNEPQPRSLFGALDTSLSALALRVSDEAHRAEVLARLKEVERRVEAAREKLSPGAMERVIPDLVAISAELRGVLAACAECGSVERLFQEKLEIAGAALAAAAGVVVDAVADRELLVVGEGFEIVGSVWTPGSSTVEVVSVGVLGPLDLIASELAEDRGVVEHRFSMRVPDDATPTSPRFSSHGRVGDLYDWSEGDAPLRQVPGRALSQLRFELSVDGEPVHLRRDIVYRFADQAIGEVRRPLRIVPKLEVEVDPPFVVWPLGSSAPTLSVSLVSHVVGPLTGELELGLPAGWSSPAMTDFRIDLARGRLHREFRLDPGTNLEPGSYRVEVAARLTEGERFASAFPEIEYPHITPTVSRTNSEVEIRAIALDLPEVDRIGYVRGASDRVPEMLSAVGLPIELLGADELRLADLSQFDVIVIGSRAYEIDPILREANPRLIDFARGGGTLIVQYQQYQFVRGGYAALPLDIHRPHGRVTDEGSAVRVLESSHPAFEHPNAIGAEDWEGWVQERGLYFAGEWDPGYVPLLELGDPGRPLERGALLIAPFGEGTYVYTGLSFFRELPAGVPGAFRLFANLLALGER